MHRGVRTVLAFVLSPAVAALLVGVFGATFRGEGTGPSWIEVFAQYCFLSSFMSYFLSYTAGTAVFVALFLLRKESFWLYTALGAALGSVYGSFVVFGSKGPVFGMVSLLAASSSLGAAVAGTFSLIRGVPVERVPSRATS